jgi:hypothetical protein
MLKTGEDDIAGFFYLDGIRRTVIGAEYQIPAAASPALKPLATIFFAFIQDDKRRTVQ